MPNKVTQDLIDRLHQDIASDTGLKYDDELNNITSNFNKSLNDALMKFNSSIFDNDGFIKRIQSYDTGDPEDAKEIKSILGNIKQEYSSSKSVNSSELLLRYDLHNIRTQMAEMNDVINTVRDAIIECNISTGEVSRTINFGNEIEENENLEDQVYELEKKHDLLYGIKNFIVTNTLANGELDVLVKPYAKIFAELEALSDNSHRSFFRESLSSEITKQFSESVNLNNPNNIKYISESFDKEDNKFHNEIKEMSKSVLENINVYNHSSVFIAEMGIDGARDFMMKEYNKYKSSEGKNEYNHFNESMENYNTLNIRHDIDEDFIEFDSYNNIKGAYIKYLDPLKTIPVKMDRKVIGYYYVTTSTDVMHKHPGQSAGIIDTSYQTFTKDKRTVDRLADIIIRTFDKKTLSKNIRLKNEIVEVIMAHKFHEGKLNFVYIPEDEVIRVTINEDEDGRGHSILEPSLFNARNYILLNLYNMLYTLNNTTTRIHYLKSSGLDKNYADTVQRAMRKFQSRRISVDDIYSYTGVLNKVGGMGEMVLPTGRNDYKALETDTIPAVEVPINLEFMEQQRREAISGTGNPNMLVINAIDEVDFAKTLELANARFLSNVSSLKLDFNKHITRLYQKLLKHETNMDAVVIQSFTFAFNTITQPQLNITADMIQNFTQLYDLTSQILFTKEELEKEDGSPTYIAMEYKKDLAKEYLPQLDFDILEEIADKVKIRANKFKLKDIKKDITIEDEDIEEIKK